MAMFERATVVSTVERRAGVLSPAVIRRTDPVEVGCGVGGAIAIWVFGFEATSDDAVGGEDSPTMRTVLAPVLEASGTNPRVSGGSPRLVPRLMRVGALTRAATDGFAAGLATAGVELAVEVGWLGGRDLLAASGWAVGSGTSCCGFSAGGCELFAVT